ncbi:MAG: outer membrane protein assembly factor BamB family protein [Gammaproteobacteria bacterium]
MISKRQQNSALRVVTFFCAMAALVACDPRKSDTPSNSDDPHVVRNPGGYEENREFISPPTLGQPIYICSSNVTIKNFLKDATLEVFIRDTPAGSFRPAVNPSVIGTNPILGVNFNVGETFVAGQAVRVTQTKDGVTSASSKIVPVTSHSEDYPDGLPKPKLFKSPLRQCGKAVLVEDVVPGSHVEVSAQNPLPAGGFDSAAIVGAFNASTEWGHNWTVVNPEFELGARITAQAQLCTDISPRSDAEITQPPPSPMPGGKVEEPIVEGQEIFKIWGEGGPGDPPEHGVLLTVRDAATNEVGKTPAPGGAPHLLGISPPANGASYTVTQSLCSEGDPGPETPVIPCEDMPAPTIKAPLPGDDKIYVTGHIPGAEILVFADGEEIGHSSGEVINLSRPVDNGETIIVIQRLGECESKMVYQIDVECALGDDPVACSADWPAFRHNGLRNARQIGATPLSDPYLVKTLTEKWTISSPDGSGFTASPVVSNGRIFIGSSAGRMYAFDADTGAELWRYPPNTEPALTSGWATAGPCANPSSSGIAASATVTRLHDREVVVFGGPDQTGRPSLDETTFGSGMGSGRVFAVDAQTGSLVWASGEVARMTGFTSGSTSELHEQVGYSSPLVLNNRVYIGIADHCDNPIQQGKVRAVDLISGNVIPDATFLFESTNTRGGGVWTYISGGLAGGIFTTTGNIRSGNPGGEPPVNHALAMVRINPANGNIDGKVQPVPFELDGDPDWAAGASLTAASCGNLTLSTMKDGWTYAGNADSPMSFRWQYPNTAYPFPKNDPNFHGDIRYHRAGAAWDDVYVSVGGGENLLVADTERDTFDGYRYLHAYNVCSGEGNRVRWIADLKPYTPEITSRHSWALGPPTVVDGIFYVGTSQGWLLAIADTSIWPGQGSRCTLESVSTATCTAMGYQVTAKPTVIKALNVGGNFQRNEPVLANDSIYISNSSGQLIRIAPE